MFGHEGQGRFGSGNDMMWNDDGSMDYEVGGRNVQRSVGGYLEENPDFGGGYSQDDGGFGSGNTMRSSMKRNMGSHSRSFGGQGGMGGQCHMREGQSGMMGGQSYVRGGQGRMMGGQSDIRGGQGHMMGGQSEIRRGQGHMMGGQSGMMGDQSGMMGGQSGMMGNQMGFGGGQQSMSGQNNNELVELLKKQSDVINKLSEKIGLDTGYGDQMYQSGYGGEEYYGSGGGEQYYGNEYDRGYYEEDYGSYFDGPRGGPRGGGPHRGPRSRMIRGRPMRGGPMQGGSRMGSFMPSRGGFTPGPGARGGMRGSPGKRRGDFQGDFGGKRQRMDTEAHARRARPGCAVKTSEQKGRENEENKKGTETMKPKATATQYRKYLRKKVQQQREEDGSFPAYEENKAIGRKYIENVEGYYCQKCRRFFRDESEAKIEHCMTWAHYQRIKNTKFPKEEDKKKDEDGADGKGRGDEAVEMAADIKTDPADGQVDEEELLKVDE
ncbi:loricrin-like isoform X2 [Haliotis asinina]|uniref:loricrin-like isoform X2 n=1 Tax=Haliotis asinina TaxID=109174 RepID=UPI003531FE84